MRALCIYTHGFPDAHGHSTAARLSWLQLTLLAHRAKVDLLALVPLNQAHDAPTPALATLCHRITPILLPPTRASGIASVLAGLARLQPPALALKASPKARAFLDEALRHHTYDLIFTHSADGLVNLPADRLRHPSAPPLAVAVEEVQWTAWRGYRPWQWRAIGVQQALQSLLWRRMQAFERARYRLAREVLCLSDREAAAVRQLDPAIPTSLLPLPVDIPAFHDQAAADSRTILFTGYFGHPPNRLAALELARKILPLVRQEIPDARLLLAGRGAASLAGPLAGSGVELDDSVPSLTPLYRSAAVTAGPIRTGEGVRGKFLEALACGCPVVTTPLGASGIQAAEEEGLIACLTPVALANAIIPLLRDPALRSRLGQAGADAVARHHSPAAFTAAFTAALDRLVPKKETP